MSDFLLHTLLSARDLNEAVHQYRLSILRTLSHEALEFSVLWAVVIRDAYDYRTAVQRHAALNELQSLVQLGFVSKSRRDTYYLTISGAHHLSELELLNEVMSS